VLLLIYIFEKGFLTFNLELRAHIEEVHNGTVGRKNIGMGIISHNGFGRDGDGAG
jgi:hypothetical protein